MNAHQVKTRVVAIVALPHSGSHLLSQLLGAHSRCVSIGELHNYDKLMNRSRGENLTTNYDQDEIFTGLDSTPEDQWHELISRNARTSRPTVSTLIDNSKRVAWCQKLMKNPGLDVQPVHLIRDPRAHLRYWTMSYDNARKIRRQRIRHSRMAPLQAPVLMTCAPLKLYIRKWLIRNHAATRLLSDAGATNNLVSYHDLATSPEKVLKRLMTNLGLDYEPNQLRYGDAEQHGTLKREYDTHSRRSAIELDVRWQDYLNSEQIQSVAADRRLNDYLDRIGLKLGENGLTTYD